MKKILAALLAACLLLAGCSTQPPQKEPDIITFSNIPWGASDDETVGVIKEMYPATRSESEYLIPGDTEYGYEPKSTNFSDPEGKYLPVCSSENVRTKEVVLQPYASSTLLDSIDGYNVSSIYLYFLESNGNKDLGKYGLYKAACTFFDIHNKDTEMITMYFHFQKKLAELYGNPDEYEQKPTYSFGKGLLRHSVWVADDGTGAVLTYHKTYYSDTGRIDEYVSIDYGTTAVNDAFKGQ